MSSDALGVKLTTQAERAYKRLDPVIRGRIDRAIDELEQGNFRDRNIRALTGPYAGSLRYRVGAWRIVFKVDSANRPV